MSIAAISTPWFPSSTSSAIATTASASSTSTSTSIFREAHRASSLVHASRTGRSDTRRADELHSRIGPLKQNRAESLRLFGRRRCGHCISTRHCGVHLVILHRITCLSFPPYTHKFLPSCCCRTTTTTSNPSASLRAANHSPIMFSPSSPTLQRMHALPTHLKHIWRTLVFYRTPSQCLSLTHTLSHTHTHTLSLSRARCATLASPSLSPRQHGADTYRYLVSKVLGMID